MSLMLALRVVTYLLVCDGIVALLLAGLIGAVGVALVVLAVLGSWWLEGAWERGLLRRSLVWGLVAAAAIAVTLDLFYLAQSVLDGMVHLLLFLIVARLFIRRARSDLRDAGFLSFFLLVATSAVTFSVGFLFVFVSFLGLGTCMLLLQHVVTETERAGSSVAAASSGRLGLDGPLIRLSVAGATATLGIAGVLFFVIPRVGQATLPLRNQLTRMVTGFSERVDLGAFGEIETDKTVVMRVYVGDDIRDPTLLPNLRWRGIVFDRFDGRMWAVGQPERTLVRRSAGGQFQVGRPFGRGPVLKQDIYLDPIGTDIVFAASRPLRIDLSAGAVSVDDMGTLSVPTESARLHYRAESELEGPPASIGMSSRERLEFSHRDRRRYLQLPPLSPGIAALARQVTAGSREPYEAARKLSAFLSSRFRYTLAKPQTAFEPLEEFLLVRRSGNCEYFAAGLAVLLRTLDIPARVVGGFQRGEWNPYGRYFMVRLSDAHAWVEAYFDDLGWVTFDPSPRASVEALARPSAVALYLDAARMRWYRYIVNWSLQDQRLFASTFHRQARGVSLAFAWPRQWPGEVWLVMPVSAGAVLGWLIWAFGRGIWARRHVGRAPRFYARALRVLARRGLVPEPAETARQFWQRARLRSPSCDGPLGRITTQYERARFGSAELTETELRELHRCLAALKHQAGGRPPDE
jgi:transglutaminase-like putative cysteine protease